MAVHWVGWTAQLQVDPLAVIWAERKAQKWVAVRAVKKVDNLGRPLVEMTVKWKVDLMAELWAALTGKLTVGQMVAQSVCLKAGLKALK